MKLETSVRWEHAPFVRKMTKSTGSLDIMMKSLIITKFALSTQSTTYNEDSTAHKSTGTK